MVDAVDSKSAVSNGVRVQVPPGVRKATVLGRRFCFVGRDLEEEVFLVEKVFSGGLTA